MYCMFNNFNSSIRSSKFSQCPKLAEITPLYKKEKEVLKENYRPGSILPNLSQIYEKIALAQMTKFLELHFLIISVDFT